MRAAIHNPYWDTLGGGERYVASFAKLLIDLGWSVDIWWPKNISADLHSRFSLDISKANFTSKKPTSSYNLLFWVSDGSLPLSFAKKTIIHFQFPFTKVRGRSVPNLIKSRFYEFVVNSEFTKKHIDSEFGVKSYVVYPPVDIDQFAPDKKTKTILYVGRFSNLTQSKGQSTLISSFKNIYQKLPGWELVIAGGTSVGTHSQDFADLKKSAADLPIKIIANPSFQDLKQLFAKASIFWSASGYGTNSPLKMEHFGISLVEAMSAGCVPLVTNLGGHSEIVTSSVNGYLWDTPSQMEELTLKLVTNSVLLSSLSQAAINRSKMFSISQFNSTFSKLLNS